MTREQIVEQLDSIVGTYEILLGNGVNSDILDVDDIEAIKEAISALSAEGEYIKKEDIVKYIDNMPSELTEDGRRMVRQIRLKEFVADLPTYSFPDREKGEQLYSDLLRVKHNTMSIDSLIDKVYADMRGE